MNLLLFCVILLKLRAVEFKKFYECDSRNRTWCRLENPKENENEIYDVKLINSQRTSLDITVVTSIVSIEFFPADLCKVFLNLLQLDLKKNTIKTLELNSLRSCTKLKQLSLKENRIEVLEDKTFEKNINLESLDLSLNKLRRFTCKTFVGLQNLKSLNLVSNKLFKILPEELGTMPKLKSINLSCNFLYEIDFEGISNITEIGIDHNLLKYKDVHKFVTHYSQKIKFIKEKSCPEERPYKEIELEDTINITYISHSDWDRLFDIPIVNMFNYLEVTVELLQQNNYNLTLMYDKQQEQIEAGRKDNATQLNDKHDSGQLVAYALSAGVLAVLVFICSIILYHVNKKAKMLKFKIVNVERKLKVLYQVVQEHRWSSTDSSDSSNEYKRPK